MLHLNVNNLLPKLDQNRLNVKRSNASIIRISESKLESSILNSDEDIAGGLH